MVDETIAMYEQTLEHIKNGGLYSKSITGPDGVVEQNAVMASGAADIGTAIVAQDIGISLAENTAQPEAENAEELLNSLQTYGVTGSVEDGLYYNGQLIRYLVDGYSVGDGGYGIRYVYTNKDGVIDVHTLREEVLLPIPSGGVDPAGPLKAVVCKGDSGYDPDLIDCALWGGVQQSTTAVSEEALGNGGGGGRTFADIFAGYARWGLRYDAGAEDARLLTLDGQPVAHFADLKPDGSVFSYENPYAPDGLRVYTEYGKDGKLAGLTAE